MGNAAAKEKFPTVVFDPDRSVNEQLEYFEPLMNTCKPFVFVNLGLRVSVQAGYGTRSEFVLPDERVLTYPFIHCLLPEERGNMFDREKGVEHRAQVEKELLPLSSAKRFEVALMGDLETDIWFTPDQLKLRVPGEVKECWETDGQIGSFVPKDGVEIILRRLHGAERYLTQQKAERQAVVSAQKQQLARIAELPSHIKCLIAQHLQAFNERKETELIECHLDKMAKGCGVSFALESAEQMNCLQL